MEEELKNEIQPEKKKGNIGIIITFIVIALTFCVSGYSIRGMVEDLSKDKEKTGEKDNAVTDCITVDPDDPALQKEVIPYSDKVVYSTYGDVFTIYMLDNGTVYYQTSASKFAGLNVCPSKEEYCKGNPTYNNDMIKVDGDGIENVKRIKMVVDINASDESFVYYAITNAGEVFKLDKHTAVKTDIKNAGDLVNVSMGPDTAYYEFTTMDGGSTFKVEAKK